MATKKRLLEFTEILNEQKSKHQKLKKEEQEICEQLNDHAKLLKSTEKTVYKLRSITEHPIHILISEASALPEDLIIIIIEYLNKGYCALHEELYPGPSCLRCNRLKPQDFKWFKSIGFIIYLDDERIVLSTDQEENEYLNYLSDHIYSFEFKGQLIYGLGTKIHYFDDKICFEGQLLNDNYNPKWGQLSINKTCYYDKSCKIELINKSLNQINEDIKKAIAYNVHRRADEIKIDHSLFRSYTLSWSKNDYRSWNRPMYNQRDGIAMLTINGHSHSMPTYQPFYAQNATIYFNEYDFLICFILLGAIGPRHIDKNLLEFILKTPLPANFRIYFEQPLRYHQPLTYEDIFNLVGYSGNPPLMFEGREVKVYKYPFRLFCVYDTHYNAYQILCID